ncbi:WD repeat-containing protein 44 [Frankliniella fusca]|uniref:WD repeat-containing protein 44 n=1 Tax=Frankliniella fusca TaxID=407009 RepID=A0AAE1I3R6_9NEOP|nr:WD repeat-containing protein 44 [Frankliniella fusca]
MSMSSSSDSDEFYDAEDETPSKSTRRSRSIKRGTLPPSLEKEINSPIKESSDLDETLIPSTLINPSPVAVTPSSKENVSENVGGPKKGADNWQGRRRFRELRQRMQTEEEDAVGSPPDSQTSSVEGIFAVPQAGAASVGGSSSGTKASHPFRIIEHDALSLQSLTSLGRVGRILGGVQDTSSSSSGRIEQQLTSTSSCSTLGGDLKEEEEEESSTPVTAQTSPVTTSPTTSSTPTTSASTAPSSPSHFSQSGFQEPDVIASTKSSIGNGSPPLSSEAPIAPPRRKKKNKGQNSTSSNATLLTETEPTSRSSQLPSPASTIESLTRDLEHSLDIRSATKGQYVVKPQDEDRARAEGPASEEPDRTKTDKVSSRSSQASNSPRGSVGSNSIGRKPSLLVSASHESAVTSIIPTVGSGTASSTSSTSMRDFSSVGTGSGGKRGRSTLGSLSSNSIGRDGGEARHSLSPRGSKERRRSAGDEQGMLAQLNMFVRTRTDSGKQLSDMEILSQVTVLNLDTGERVPLSIAEDKLPQCINPLSLHIMRLTSEYAGTETNSPTSRPRESDEESVDSKMSVPLSVCDSLDIDDAESEAGSVRKRTARFKRFLGSTVKKTMNKAKTIAQEVSHARHKEDVMDIVDKVNPNEPSNMKLKASSSHKGPYEFDQLQHIQDLSGEHIGPIWCMKFSTCGRLLATAGQDRILRVWVIRSAYAYFQEMRTKYNAEKVSPTPSQESLVSQHSAGASSASACNDPGSIDPNPNSPFMPRPFCKYTGHTSDLLDVSWSKNYFVLSSSMDKTVRLWHISRKECLCCFQHIDFVTAIVFHPRDDRYFLSGSLDGKIRLWNIPDKKVAVWNEVEGQTKLITAANFFQNGKFAVVGSYDGRCIFYHTDQLKYHTQIHVRSTRGKNSTGRKISGIEPMPGADKILVTSNDSRIRLYDLRDLSVSCKYKGYVNVSSQIKASFSHDGKYIVSGSENQCIFIWRTDHDYSKFSSVRKDRNDFWEGIKAHNAVVTCAVFAPNPEAVFRQIDDMTEKDEEKAKPKAIEDPLVAQHKQGCGGHVLVSADFNGCIKVFVNRTKPKHSSLPASALV